MRCSSIIIKTQPFSGDQIMLNTQLINEKYQFNHMSLKMSVQILLDQNIIGQAMVSSSESVC